jgi:HAD superfamily hydrolase (TIGR01509 family)
MDGTLVNLGTHVEWEKALEEIVKEYIKEGCLENDFDIHSSPELFTLIESMWSKTCEIRGIEEAEKIQASVFNILSAHEEKGSLNCTLMPSCVSTLEWLKEHNYPLGICTSNSLECAMTALKQQGIEEYFSVVIGRSTAYKMKPSPDQLKACFEALEVSPMKSVMVGDSVKDVSAGNALGCYTIAIPIYFSLKKLEEANPDKIIRSLSELPSVILGLEHGKLIK